LSGLPPAGASRVGRVCTRVDDIGDSPTGRCAGCKQCSLLGAPGFSRVVGGYPNATGSSTSHAAAGWIPLSGAYACHADVIRVAATISAIPGAVFSLSSARTTAYGVATVAACGIATTAAATRAVEEEEEEEECQCCGVGFGRGCSSNAEYGAAIAGYGAARVGAFGYAGYDVQCGAYSATCADASGCTRTCCTCYEAKEGGAMLEMRRQYSCYQGFQGDTLLFSL
jgi:hypothetical protein